MDAIEYSSAKLHTIVEKYADMILRISFVQLKHLQDAEDITQEVFVRLVEAKPPLQSEEHLKAWLIRVVLNLCKDHWKSAWIKRTIPIRENLSVINQNDSSIIYSIMNLSKSSRQVIILHYFVGYDIAEIASILREKPSAIATRLHRARKKLKIKLEEDEFWRS